MMEGFNYVPKETVKSVLIEEMLHLTLVANIMNAVGCAPSLTHSDFVPRYPHTLPHSGDHFKIHIEKFSENALNTFLHIEKPESKGSIPIGEGFRTIGQFYAYVGSRIDYLCDMYGEETVFCGKIDLQIRPEDYYGSGAVVVVKNRNTAHEAINTIAEQGEGAHEGLFDADRNILNSGEEKELAHYYRFKQLLLQQHYTKKDTPKSGPSGKKLKVDYDKIYPLKKDTHKSEYPEGSDIRGALNAFANSYSELLTSLEDAFKGNRSRLTEGITRMFALRNQALAIIQTPVDNGKNTVGLDFTPN
jgi:hypothetical protein